MSGTLPSPRRIAGALAVLLTLPPAALADLAERLVDRLDAMDGDPDQEPDHEGCCEAGDDDPASSRPALGVRGMFWSGGDPDDDEADQDDESGPYDDWHTWPPVSGPDGCGTVRLALG